MDARYFTLDLAIHRQGESYHLTMNHSDPGSQAQVAPLRGIAAIDPPALIALELDLAAYGTALAAQLFAEPAVKQRFLQVEAAAQATDSYLRLSLSLDPRPRSCTPCAGSCCATPRPARRSPAPSGCCSPASWSPATFARSSCARGPSCGH